MSEEYIRVLTDSQIIISRLQNLLAEEQIHSRIRNDNESARLAGFGTPLNASQLFILKKDIEKATPILEAYKAQINS